MPQTRGVSALLKDRTAEGGRASLSQDEAARNNLRFAILWVCLEMPDAPALVISVWSPLKTIQKGLSPQKKRKGKKLTNSTTRFVSHISWKHACGELVAERPVSRVRIGLRSEHSHGDSLVLLEFPRARAAGSFPSA